MAGIKVYPADKWLSRCVRCRPGPEGWSCEVCHVYYPEGHRGGLEASHLVSRGVKSTRWNADNIFSHCTSCHFKLGGNPVEFVEWAMSQLGHGLYEIVRDKSREQYKGWKMDLGEISRHYRAEYRRMEKLRSDGVQGRIEFQSWN